MRPYVRPLLLPLLIVLLLAMIGLFASRYTSLEWLIRNDKWLRATIEAQPVRSCLIGFLLYVAFSLIPGIAGKSVVLGWLYGLVFGVVIVNCALVTAAVITFLMCRHYLRAAVQARFGLYLRPVQERMSRDGAMYLLTLRLAHAPFSLMNYAAGAGTNVPLLTFWWTTQLGLLPRTIVFVFAGTRLPTLEELQRYGPLELLDGPMIAALIGTAFLPWLGRRVMRAVQLTRGTAQQLPEQVPGAHRKNDT